MKLSHTKHLPLSDSHADHHLLVVAVAVSVPGPQRPDLWHSSLRVTSHPRLPLLDKKAGVEEVFNRLGEAGGVNDEPKVAHWLVLILPVVFYKFPQQPHNKFICGWHL